MKKAGIITIILLHVGLLIAQQDPQYSHFMFNQAGNNPGFAGYSGQINALVINRQQWMGLKGAPQTTFMAIDAPFKLFGINSGGGLIISDDQLGFEKNFTAKLTYAYIKNIGAGNIGIGISAGIFNKSINGTWQFPEQQEPVFPNGDSRKLVFDLDLGAYFAIENFHIGIASAHITKPELAFTGGGNIYLKRHILLNSAYNIQLANALIDLTPSVMAKTDGTALQFDININLLYNKKIWGGVTYRNKDAMILLAGTSVFSDIKIGLAYEIGLSKIRKSNIGSFEVLLGYSFMLEGGRPPQTYRSVRFL